MDGSWHVKCGSTSQSPAPAMAYSSLQELQNQMEMNRGQFFYPNGTQDLRSTLHERMHYSMAPSTLNLSFHKEGYSEQGNSFLAHLSGPPSQVHHDFQALSNVNAFSFSRSANVNALESRFMQTSSDLLSGHWNNLNLQDSVHLSPAKPVLHHLVPDNEKIFFSSHQGEWNGTTSVSARELHDKTILRSSKTPLEAKSSISSQPPANLSGAPRVFCLGTSGYLLLSNTGLLGIVCSCHFSHMSVSKFCEHSGLCDMSPGDAVRIDSGETIAQWRKLYFANFGIRVPEDPGGWDWPEGLSLNAGAVNFSSVPRVPENSYLGHMIASPQGLATRGENMMCPKKPRTGQNLAIDPLQYKHKKNIEDGDTFLPKSLIGSSQSNLQAVADNRTMDFAMPNSSSMPKLVDRGLDDGSHSLSAWIDAVLKTGSSCLTHPSLQNFRTVDQNCMVNTAKFQQDGVTANKEFASSNVELRLGQPNQQSQYLRNAALPYIEAKPLDIPVDHRKSRYSKQIIHSASDRYYFQRASVPCDSFPRGEQSRLIIRDHAFNVNNTRDGSKFRNVEVDAAKGSLFTPLLHLQPERGVCSKNSSGVVGIGESVMPKTLYSESNPSKATPVNACWNGGSTSGRQANVPELGLLRVIDGRKDTGNVYDCSRAATDPPFKIQKRLERHGVSAGIGVNSSSLNFRAVNAKNHFPYQSPNATLDTHGATNLLNHPVNSPFMGGTGHTGHVFMRSMGSSGGSGQISQSAAASTCFPLSASTPMPDLAPTTSKQENVNLGPRILDDNMRLLALKQISELSRQHAISSIAINQELRRCCFPSGPTIHQGILDPSTSREQRHGSGSNVLGYNCCNLSTMTQGCPLCSRDISNQCQFSNEPFSDVQSSSRLGKREVVQSSEHVNFCQKLPSTHFLRNCGCAAQANCREYSKSRIGNSLVTSRDEPSCFCHEASASEFVRNYNVPTDCTMPLDKRLKQNGELCRSQCFRGSKWRDVPSKGKEACGKTWLVKGGHGMTCKDPSAFDNSRNAGCKQGDDAAERSIGFGSLSGSSKGQEKSNVSSGCSAPAVTQASFEVNNVDSCTVDANANNLVVDEGSAIDKYESSESNDPIEIERSADSPGSSCKSNSRKEATSQVLNVQSPHSLVDELKLMNTLSWKKGQSHSPTSLTTCGKSDNRKELGLSLKAGKKRKFMKLEMIAENKHEAEPVGKNAEKTSNVKSICNEKADSSFDVACYQRNAKPVVCGKYGEICCGELIGDEQKPVKYGSLSRIQKTTRRIDPNTCKAKLTSQRESNKRKIDDSSEGFGVSSDLRQEEKCGSNHASVLHEVFADELKKACIGGFKTTDTEPSMWETERADKSEKGSIAHAQTKHNCKGGIQTRSLYELLAKGKQSNAPLDKISGCMPKTELRDNLKKAEINFSGERDSTCARTEGFKGRKRDDFWHGIHDHSRRNRCLVPQEQLNAWAYINGKKPCIQGLPKRTTADIEYDCRKEYARYKQIKDRKHLVVYKSGIHALGLYTSRCISRAEMVVEYVGEIVSSRVADKRESEYMSGRKVQYKSACYFFRIDKEHIIDATRKGGIARFVNHSCQPNCVAKVISVRNDKKVIFFAERDIYPGEEITYDYHFNNEDEGKKIPCFCDSKNCRRYLN